MAEVLSARGGEGRRNVNGRTRSSFEGNTVEIVALKSARAGSPEAAKEALDRIEILDSSSGNLIKIETRLPRGGHNFHMGGTEVRYTIKVPAAAEVEFATVNGGIEVTGLTGRIRTETTNGGIVGRDIGGPIEANTTNGGVEVDVTRIAEHGVKLGCTNGDSSSGTQDARATISAAPAAASARTAVVGPPNPAANGSREAQWRRSRSGIESVSQPLAGRSLATSVPGGHRFSGRSNASPTSTITARGRCERCAWSHQAGR